MPRSEEADLSTNSCSDVTSSVTLGKSIYSKDPRVLIFDVQKLAGVISESLVGFDDMFIASDIFMIAQGLYCCLLKRELLPCMPRMAQKLVQ